MKIRDLRDALKLFDQDKDIIVFNSKTKQLDDVISILNNAGHCQLNVEEG